MKWAADENVDEQIVVALRAQGHDVWSVAEQDGGLEDEAILAEALVRQAVLITGDKDFGEIVFRQRRASFGVVLIRLPGLQVDTRGSRGRSAGERAGRGGRQLHGSRCDWRPGSPAVRIAPGRVTIATVTRTRSRPVRAA